MKKLITVILLLACIGLAIALVVVKNRQRQQQASNASTILDFSNQLSSAHEQITGLGQVNLVLSNDLAASRENSSSLSNQLDDAQSAISRNEQEITNLNSRLADLEAQNKSLDEHAAELTNTIAQLNTQIAETQAKLAATQTNNVALENELKKQVADRAALEEKFTNISKMRDQIHKLKMDELVATRLRWMREGTDPSQQMKGAQRLMQHTPRRETRPAAAENAGNLNVEVEAGGAVRIIPSTPQTNSPE